MGLPTNAMFICFVKLNLNTKITVNQFVRLRIKKDEVWMRKFNLSHIAINFTSYSHI